jgi:UDP-glucose 4-epimerase
VSGKKVLITGISGYIGSALCRRFEHTGWCERVDGCDIRAPLDKLEKVAYREMDINDPGLAGWVAERAPDVLVHLAFVLNPMHDEARMRRINVDGTRAVLDAAAAASTRQVMVASSGTAYGAWPDNPVPLRETDPIRPHPGFQYAREKAEVEELCADFMAARSEVVFSIIRPCVLYGPNVHNYLSRLLTGLPTVVGLAGYNPDLQFVHEDDVARAILTILEGDARGAFNIAPPDTLTMEETLRMTGKRVVRLPDWVLDPLADFLWRHRINLLGAPASFLDFMRYPWVLDPGRLIDELGFEFRYSSREALTVMLRAKGVLR